MKHYLELEAIDEISIRTARDLGRYRVHGFMPTGNQF